MRRGEAGSFPHQDGRGGVIGIPPSHHVASPYVASPYAAPVPTRFPHSPPVFPPVAAAADPRATIARLFVDLRNAIHLTPAQVARRVETGVAVIAALESGNFEQLPHEPETSRIVLAYTALAGIDGRQVLAAIGELQRQASHQGPPQQSRRAHGQHGHSVPVDRLLQAGTALASGARRLPAGAIKQVRERPQRALYAVSLPLAIVLLLLNTSSLQAAMGHVPRPVARMVKDVRHFFQEQFAPVRDGLRWIEVDDPRRRRGDKLRTQGQSD